MTDRGRDEREPRDARGSMRVLLKGGSRREDFSMYESMKKTGQVELTAPKRCNKWHLG